MVGKKGYMRTLEVMLALVLTFAFVLYILPAPDSTVEKGVDAVLLSFIDDQSFRAEAFNITSCINKGDATALNSLLDNSLPQGINYAICPEGTLPTLPRKKVNAQSIYFAGNITNSTNKIIRLYYWE